METQLAEVARLQRELLTSRVPTIHHADVEVLFRPADVFSGDLYHMQRLDESRVAIILADATGHDHAAGMLAVFARQTLCLAECSESSAAAFDPAELLARLNREIVARDLGECQFVAAICAVYDEATGVIRWARAGAPLPILLRRDGRAMEMPSEGPIAGMSEDSIFETVECRLTPGDRFYLHTDGMEHALLDCDPAGSDLELRDTTWFAQLGQTSLVGSIEAVAERLAFAVDAGRPADDVTIVALQRT